MNIFCSYVMRILALIVMGLAMSVPQVQALSCAEPDIEREFNWAQASEKVYYIFVGELELPKNTTASKFTLGNGHDITHLQFQDRSQDVAGRFTGYILAHDARSDTRLKDVPITVRLECLSNWCGSLPQAEQKLIMFVEEQEGKPPLLLRGPCGGLSHNYNPGTEFLLRTKL